MLRHFVLLMVVVLCASCGGHRASPPLAQPVAAPPPDFAPDLPEPSSTNPVTAVAWLTPRDLAARQTAQLRVRLRIAPGHYLYAAASPDAPGSPVSLRLQPVDFVRPTGDWTFPSGDGNNHLTGVVEYALDVRVAEYAATGPHAIACHVRYQACTPELCWPPRTLTPSAAFTVESEHRP